MRLKGPEAEEAMVLISPEMKDGKKSVKTS